MKNFVDSKWLMKNLNKDNLVILDVRSELSDPSKGFEDYKKGHIKGAQYVSLEDTMTGELSLHGGRHPLPKIEDFVENMKKLGIENESTIVIYDSGSISMAARLWFLLKYIGKEDVFILEGGIGKWEEDKGEITKDIPKVKKSKSLSVNLNNDMIVDIDYVKNVIDNSDIAIVDARNRERYNGEIEPIDKIAGHIPSSLNYPWTDLVKDGDLISIESSKKYFEKLEDYDEIIVHCGSGITGIVDMILMEEIGLKSKLYVGGFSDWISYSGNEIIQKEKLIILN